MLELAGSLLFAHMLVQVLTHLTHNEETGGEHGGVLDELGFAAAAGGDLSRTIEFKLRLHMD